MPKIKVNGQMVHSWECLQYINTHTDGRTRPMPLSLCLAKVMHSIKITLIIYRKDLENYDNYHRYIDMIDTKQDMAFPTS